MMTTGPRKTRAEQLGGWMLEDEHVAQRGKEGEREGETRLNHGMLLDPSASFSADMDLTSSSTQRTSDATCSASTS